MNSANIVSIRPQMPTTAVSSAQSAGVSTASQITENSPIQLAKQDASDVIRQGTSGNLRTSKERKKENSKKIERSMSSVKKEKAQEISGVFLTLITNRKHGNNDDEDLDFARKDVEDFLSQSLADNFDDAEKLAILYTLQDNAIVSKDTVLKKAIQNAIDDIFISSTSAQMAFASIDIIPNSLLFSSGSEARESTNKVLLTYTNQEAFLDALVKEFGDKKTTEEFPTILSHCMNTLSASMDSLATSNTPEKGAVYAATSGISSLQQMIGVEKASTQLINRMEQRYPKGDATEALGTIKQFTVPTAIDILQGILKIKDSPSISKSTAQECFPMLDTSLGSPTGELGSGIMRIIQEETPYTMFSSIDKKDAIVKAIGEIVETAESVSV